MGYIDKARSEKVLLRARSCYDAAQQELIELYAKQGGKPVGEAIVQGKNPSNGGKNNKDQDVTDTTFAKRILELAEMTGDDAPYLFMFAVGDFL